MASTIEEKRYVGKDAVEQLIANINEALDTKQPKGDYVTPDDVEDTINTALSQAKNSGEFDGSDGVGIVNVTIKEV